MIDSMLPLTIAVMGGISILLLVLSCVPGKNPLAERIERMTQVNERSYDTRLARFEAIIAGESQSTLQGRLLAAGWYNVTPFAFALRGLSGLAFGAAIGALAYVALPVKAVGIVAGVALALVCWRLPKISLDRAIAKRRAAVDRSLPDFLDLLSATVRAGLALSAALIQAAEATVGPLRQELNSAQAEIRLGRPRAEALQAMAQRVGDPQLSAMVSTIVQAETLGANIASVLNELAIDSRHRRWTLAEERASQLPIKMLIPMAFLMMPSLYVMIFGPVLAHVVKVMVH